MKKSLLFLIIISGLFSFCKSELSNQEKQKLKDTSVLYFSEFKQRLQKELLESITQTGTVGAIDKCKTVSPALEKELSEKYNLTLKRVSDKPRNPEHLADEWEANTLSELKKLAMDGKEIPLVSFSDGTTFRVMKAIPIDNAMCLQCHGSKEDIKEDTMKKIQELYPTDKALGYSLNDLRGAFSATWRRK
jgi:hypothetical protein